MRENYCSSIVLKIVSISNDSTRLPLYSDKSESLGSSVPRDLPIPSEDLKQETKLISLHLIDQELFQLLELKD